MKISTTQITLVALFWALCIIVPVVFHSIGAGAIFLPMFLPILLSGFIVKFPLAMFVGLLGPWLSALATGMPPVFPTAPIMSLEGMVAAGVASWLFQIRKWNLWPSLICAIFAERITYVIMVYLLSPLLGLPPKVLSTTALVSSVPGVLLQLFLIPILLYTIWRIKPELKNDIR